MINDIVVHINTIIIRLTFSDHIIQLFLKLSILVIYVSYNSLLECAMRSLGRTIRINISQMKYSLTSLDESDTAKRK